MDSRPAGPSTRQPCDLSTSELPDTLRIGERGSQEAEIRALSGSARDFLTQPGRDLFAKARAFSSWRRDRVERRCWPYARALATAPGPETCLVSSGGGMEEGLNFASQDYLSLATHPRVRDAAKDAVDVWGVHSAGSCALAGSTVDTRVLEQELTSFLGYPHVTLFPTGWAAGFGVIKALIRSTDVVLLDALAHNCLQEGASAATRLVHRFRHLDCDHAAAVLAALRRRFPQAGVASLKSSRSPATSTSSSAVSRRPSRVMAGLSRRVKKDSASICVSTARRTRSRTRFLRFRSLWCARPRRWSSSTRRPPATSHGASTRSGTSIRSPLGRRPSRGCRRPSSTTVREPVWAPNPGRRRSGVKRELTDRVPIVAARDAALREAVFRLRLEAPGAGGGRP